MGNFRVIIDFAGKRKFISIFKIILFFLFFSLLASCSKNPIEREVSSQENGNLSLNFSAASVPENVASIWAYLFREGEDTLSMALSVSGQNAEGSFYNLSIGDWTLLVNAMDISGAVIYSGSAIVTIFPGQTTVVNLNLQQTTGNLEIHVTWGDNFSGSAISLDGDSDWVCIPFDDSYRPETEITVEAWFKLYDPISPYQCFRILSCTHSGGWTFAYNNSHANVYDGKLKFTLDINGEYYRVALDSISTQELPSNEWIHIAGTYDSQVMKLYINGDLVDSLEVSGNIGYQWENALLIGAEAGYAENPDPYYYPFFHGSVDEVRIWDRARSAEEINRDMLKMLTGLESGLCAYWNFNEGSGVIVHDATSNDNDGYLVGDAQFISSEIFK